MAIDEAGVGLVRLDDTIDDIAAKALRAAREAEEKARRKKEADASKVGNPANSPRKSPTSAKNPRE
jgi:hypothetical protein